MRTLSIDTTSMHGSVALSDGMRLVAQEQQGVARTHSERLISSIDHLISIANWERTDIEAIAVAIGPGSFTGLRIGLAAAKGMALALDCRLAGVSSLQSLAFNGSSFGGAVVPLIDARRGELYAAAWQFSGRGRPKQLMKECVLPPFELIRRLKAMRGPMMLTGDGAIAYGAKIKKALGARAVIPEGTALFPQAINLAILAHARLEKGMGDDPSKLVPNYIRHSDAEIGFGGKGKALRHKKGMKGQR